uniref:Uncharacterized protein n=1 Tax=Setaria digitata TaxID=48799 RepID=A0A915PQ67_9BILA
MSEGTAGEECGLRGVRERTKRERATRERNEGSEGNQETEDHAPLSVIGVLRMTLTDWQYGCQLNEWLGITGRRCFWKVLDVTGGEESLAEGGFSFYSPGGLFQDSFGLDSTMSTVSGFSTTKPSRGSSVVLLVMLDRSFASSLGILFA